MLVLGLDIGGANIKAATADGDCASVAFAIWKNKAGLLQELKRLPFAAGTQPDLVALTMTAELADCFESKAKGIEFIVTTVAMAFPDSVVRVWMTSGEFSEPHDAIELPQLVAAANWHALATWAGRAVPVGPALLIDVGSTTTDVIPLLNGIPCPQGFTDLQRLAYSELVYTGVRRTPICAIVQHVPLLDESQTDDIDSADTLPIPVASELFATSLDVHLINGNIAVDLQDLNTADNRPATQEAAMNRLAHVVCCDRDEISDVQLSFIAGYVADQQVTQIASAVINRLRYISDLAGVSPDAVQILFSGSGDWLAEKVIANCNIIPQQPSIRLRTMFVRNVTDCACAFAVARLAAERCLDDLLPVSDLYGQ